jgi:hypothetical protein
MQLTKMAVYRPVLALTLTVALVRFGVLSDLGPGHGSPAVPASAPARPVMPTMGLSAPIMGAPGWHRGFRG